MKTIVAFFFLFMFQIHIFSQEIQSPLLKNNFSKITSYDELSQFVQLLDKNSDLMKVETIGHSVEGRNLYAMLFSESEFGEDQSKIKVLIFAQQHGNEQSGKEGALLLASELIKPENRYLFEKIDFALIPQMNPDGSELNKRRNANNMDLNRNHLILTEPETMALHSLFDQYQFEVTMDVHEYSPYGEDWKKYGYRKNAEVTLGGTTNLNVSNEIREFSNNKYLPFFNAALKEKGFSSLAYCPGGPPDKEYIRHSTFDINDGRQSLGIQNSFSLIQEGMNGKDDSIENIGRRAEGQMEGMLSLLNFVYQNNEQIKEMIKVERAALISGISNPAVSVQSEHISTGEVLQLPLFSYFSGNDTVVNVLDYRPEVNSVFDVEKPLGYLIPADLTELVEWAKRQSLEITKFKKSKKYKIEQYFINSIDSIDFERDIIINPMVTLQEFEGKLSNDEYYFIPTEQLKGNLVVIALEPKSMLGLATYKNYSYLLNSGKTFPVLRVEKK